MMKRTIKREFILTHSEVLGAIEDKFIKDDIPFGDKITCVFFDTQDDEKFCHINTETEND